MDAIVLLGPPGAGKGTVAEMLKKSTPYQHVSTGDMLRAAIKAGSEVGLKAKSYMDKGELVPDAAIMGIVGERLEKEPNGRFMFDGFPRTNEQAELLDKVIERIGGKLRRVFLLDVSRAVLIDRMCGRRICKTCGAVYHERNIPPKKAGICDVDGGPLVQRPDDKEDVVANRLDVYQRQTASLISYYEGKGLLYRVAAEKSGAETEKRIRAELGL